MNTTQLTTKINTDHQELSRLLPWFVNKSLQGDELKAVESHVNACLTCKREVIQLSKLAHAVKHEGMLDSAENASFARLKMRLHGQQPEAHRHQQSVVSDNIVHFHANNRINNRISNWYRPALAMAAAVLLSLTFMLPMTVDQTGYRTLSNGEVEKTIGANEIRVVFAEGLDSQKKRAIIAGINGQIVDVPTAQGVYTVRLADASDAKHTLAVIDLLKNDDNVIFAEPAYALLSSMHKE